MTRKSITKLCSVAAMVLFVILALGPAKWTPRLGLGWQADHFLGYFVLTSLVCVAWLPPFTVGGALIVGGALLEGLQAFTPDRHPDLRAASWGAAGALGATLLVELFIRARKRTIRTNPASVNQKQVVVQA